MDGLRHEALLYRDEGEFVAGTLPLIEDGVEASEPVMVAVSAAKIELLRDRLGKDSEAVEFADMGEIGRNPTRLISVWRDFVANNGGARRLHGIGEPAWVGRGTDELEECSHHEALLNRAFEGGPSFRLMCPYDASGLDGVVLDHALRNHPWIVDAGGTRTSAAYLDPERMPDPLADPLASPPPEADQLAFSSPTELRAARELARSHAAASGIPPARVADAVFAVNEVVTNSLCHGGGAGRLYAWEVSGAVVFEIRDAGRIPDPMIGRARPDSEQPSGRGLWMVNELCDLVQMRSGEWGSSVRLWVTAHA